MLSNTSTVDYRLSTRFPVVFKLNETRKGRASSLKGEERDSTVFRQTKLGERETSEYEYERNCPAPKVGRKTANNASMAESGRDIRAADAPTGYPHNIHQW